MTVVVAVGQDYGGLVDQFFGGGGETGRSGGSYLKGTENSVGHEFIVFGTVVHRVLKSSQENVVI